MICRTARIASRFDYAEYGGAPLLGPKGICTNGHGKDEQLLQRHHMDP